MRPLFRLSKSKGAAYCAQDPDRAISCLVGAPNRWLKSGGRRPGAPFALDDLLSIKLDATQAARLAQHLIDRDAVWPIVRHIVHQVIPECGGLRAFEHLTDLRHLVQFELVSSELPYALISAEPTQPFTSVFLDLCEYSPYLAGAVARQYLNSRAMRGPLPLTSEHVDALLELSTSPSYEQMLVLACCCTLDDPQFARLMSVLLVRRGAINISLLGSQVTSRWRLDKALSLLAPGSIHEPLIWMGPGAGSDWLDSVAPYCSSVALADLLAGAVLPGVYPSAHLVERWAHQVSIADLVGVDARSSVFGGLVGLHSSLPRWYVARLLLRVPGLAAWALSVNLPSPGRAIDLALRRLGVYPMIRRDVMALLENPAATLGEALAAARILEDA